MSRWIFEPGHTEAQFKARHMMVTWVRGLFKDIHGSMEFDWESAWRRPSRQDRRIEDLDREADRDAHLRSADFFDVDGHPSIDFTGRFTERTGDIDFRAEAELRFAGSRRAWRSTSPTRVVGHAVLGGGRTGGRCAGPL